MEHLEVPQDELECLWGKEVLDFSAGSVASTNHLRQVVEDGDQTGERRTYMGVKGHPDPK